MRHLSVCKSFEFAYAHHLPGYDGLCVNNHGHTGKIEVEVDSGLPLQYPSMVCDFNDMKKYIQPIINMMDHKDLYLILNDPVYDEWNKIHLRHTVINEKGESVYPPTSENIIEWFRCQLERACPDMSIIRIRFWESPSSYTEWKK